MKFFSSGTRIWLHLYDKSNVPRAVFQMFEPYSTPIWPRSDGYKLGSEHPIFSWLTGMNNSREDNIVVELSTADSSVSVIPLSIRNTGLSEGLPTVWLSTQPALYTTSGHRWYTLITHTDARKHTLLIHMFY